MATDEHGLPLPDGRLLPLAVFAGETVVDKDGEEVETWVDPDFFVHAANNIVDCRDIVRRLAENEEMTADQWVRLIVDAKELWTKMQREAKGDDVQV